MAWSIILLLSLAQAPSPWDALPHLRHKDPAVRQAACRQLGSMGDRATCAVSPLIALLDDPALDVRIAAAEALGDIGHPAVRELLQADAHWREPDEGTPDSLAAYFTIGRPIPRSLIGSNASPQPRDECSPEVRLALRRVGKLLGPALLAVLQSERATVAARRRAMRELQSTRPYDPDFVPTLIDLLEHEELKEHAASALASLGAEIADGLPALVRHVGTDPPNAQMLMLTFLNQRTQADLAAAQKQLAQLLPTVDPWEVRAIIASHLAESNDPQVRRTLFPLLDAPETAQLAAQMLLLEGGPVGKRAEGILLKAIRKSKETNEQFLIPAEVGLRWLRDPNRRGREAAMNEHVYLHDWTPAALDALAAVLAGADVAAKRRAMTLVERHPLRDARIEPAMRKLLIGSDPELRDAAAAVLVEMDVVDDRLTQALTAGLLRRWFPGVDRRPDLADWPRRLAPVAMRPAETEEPEVARVALAHLRSLGPAAAPMVPRLIALRGKPELSGLVDWALEGIVTETFEDRCKRLRAGLRPAPGADPADKAAEICLLPVRARELVADLLKPAAGAGEDDSPMSFGSEDHLGSLGIAGALATIGSPEANAALLKRVGDPKLPLLERIAAVNALPHLGNAGLEATDAVMELLSIQPRVLVRILAGIGAEVPDDLLKLAANLEPLAEVLPQVRPTHVRSSRPAVPMLLRYEGLDIADALGDRGPAAAAALVPVLREMLSGESEAQRIRALHAVNMLETGTEPLLKELIACLESPDETVVAGASYALARLGPAAAPAVPRLRRLLYLGQAPMPTAVALGCIGSPEAITILRRMLDDPDGAVRTAGCAGLWHAGPKAAPAIAALRELTEDPDVSLLACETLLRVAPGRAARWVRPVLETKAAGRNPAEDFHGTGGVVHNHAIDLLADCGPSAVPQLVRLLALGDGESAAEAGGRRVAAFQALGRIGPEAAEALPAMRAWRSHDWTMRALKAAAIARIERRVGPCVELLRESLRMPGSPMIDELLAAIAECGEAAALADFSWAPDADVRRQATEALGGLPLATEITGRHLAARLDDTDPEVRFAAAHAFHRLGPAARPALPALRELEAIDDPDLRETVREVRRAIEPVR